jgi:hypothetical protein
MKNSTLLAMGFAALGAAAIGACGSSSGTGGTQTTSDTGTGGHVSTTTTASGGATGTGGTTATGGATAAGGATGTGGSVATCSGATPVALTVLNFDAWCTVSVAGGTGSALASQTVCVADGSVALEATANAGFQLGDWYGTTGDSGSGDPGTVTGTKSDTTVSVSGTSACVSVCCPFTGGTGCPGTDACP